MHSTWLIRSGHAAPRISTASTLYSVQLLRFIAAALVVISHIRGDYRLAPFGDFGVDIFFVISGFIIYHVTRRSTDYFFTRRLIRIVPLYWLGTLILASVALIAPTMLRDVQFDGPRLLASLFFFPYWTTEHGFHPILLLGWTLNYEILFYFVFFVAMRISHRYRFFVCSGILVALGLSHPLAAPESAHFFWSGTYIIEFIYGMAIAVVLEQTRFLSVARLLILMAALALTGYCILLAMTDYFETGDLRFVFVGVPSAALVLAVLACEQSIRALPSSRTRLISFMGDLSFATYIFHAYIMGLLKRLIGLDMNIVLYSAIVLSFTIAVAAAAFLLVESPSRAWLTSRLVRVQPSDEHTATAS